MKLFEQMEKSEVVGKEVVKKRKRSVEKRSSADAADNSERKGDKTVDDVPPSPRSALDTKPLVIGKEVKRRRRSVEKGSSAADSSECKGEKTVDDVPPLPSPVAETEPLEMSHVVSAKEVKKRKRSVDKGSSAEAADGNEYKGDKMVQDTPPLPCPVMETKPLEMSPVVGVKEVRRRKRSVERRSSVEATNDSECKGEKTVEDASPLPSPVAETKPLELSTVVGDKEVKRQKHSTEKGSSTEPAENNESEGEKMVEDAPPLPSPVAETKALELSTADTTTVKCDDDVEVSAVNVIDTKATADSCTAADMAQGNDQSDIIDHTTSDLSVSDTKVQLSHGISESSVSPNESPSKPSTETDPTDTEVLEKLPEVKLDADNTDATADTNIAVQDLPATVPEKTTADEVKLLEKMPSVEVSKRDADITSVEEAGSAVSDEPKPVTTGIMKTAVKAEIIDKVKKSDVVLEMKPRAVRGNLKPPSTAKLKFGMYSSKPLWSRTWVKAGERVVESSSDSDEDAQDENTSESETARKPERPSVKLTLHFLSANCFSCNKLCYYYLLLLLTTV